MQGYCSYNSLLTRGVWIKVLLDFKCNFLLIYVWFLQCIHQCHYGRGWVCFGQPSPDHMKKLVLWIKFPGPNDAYSSLIQFQVGGYPFPFVSDAV